MPIVSVPPLQPGWYPDVSNRTQLRYWDGATWTAFTAQPQYGTNLESPTPPDPGSSEDHVFCPDLVGPGHTEYVGA